MHRHVPGPVGGLTYAIASLDTCHAAIRRLDATHCVSLLDPGTRFPDFGFADPRRHLRLTMLDTDRTGDADSPQGPSAEHVRRLVAFARTLVPGHRVLFHCLAGQSRSPAAALICDLALRIQSGAAEDRRHLLDLCVDTLRMRQPRADPNQALLRLADPLLACDGALATLCFGVTPSPTVLLKRPGH